MTTQVVSHHLLRRTARKNAHRLNRMSGSAHFEVKRYQRGPWRWAVVQIGHDEQA